jgi:hypothetical protein
MARIQISSASNGSPVHYTLVANPSFYDAQDSRYIGAFPSSNGDYVYHTKGFDNRIRVMRWESYEVTSRYVASTEAYFRSIEGAIRYFNFNDVSSANVRWTTSAATSWKKARVVAVKSSYKSGGRLAYDHFELHLQPER